MSTTEVLDLVKIVLSWQVILFVTFLFIRKPIYDYLNNLTLVKYKDLELHRGLQQNVEKTSQVETKVQPVSPDEGEDYKIMYLKRAIVFNTALVLLAIHNQGGVSEYWLTNKAQVPPGVTDAVEERDAIKTALINNKLIEYSSDAGGRYTVTKDGQEFLRKIKLIA